MDGHLTTTPSATRARLAVSAVDYHTAGEPFRIVTGGVMPLRGCRILDKRRYAQANLDHIRRLLVFEPRGHADMYGCFVTEPEDDGADLGVVFFHNAGYSTACGHGTIALVTWALESGVLGMNAPFTEVVVDVPSGRLPTTARVEGDRVVSVRFRNVPSYVHERAVNLVTSRGAVQVDISFGGAFYASVDADNLGLGIAPADLGEMIRLGREIKRALEEQMEVVHPAEPDLRDIYGVIFYARDDAEGIGLTQRNVTIFADGEVDRSPCGSGTSARLALLDDSGELARGETLTHLSIIDTRFTARVVDDARVGPHSGVVTEVEGSAYFSGSHEFALEPGDPVGEGFLLR